MTSPFVRSTGVGARRIAALGLVSILGAACSGVEPAAPGSGRDVGGAGNTSGGGTGGSGVSAGNGGVPTAGVGGGAGSGAGVMNGGSAGTTSDTAGMAGSLPTGGGGLGGSNASGGSGGSQTLSFRTDIFPVFEMLRDPPFVYPGAGSFQSCVAAGVCHGAEAVAPGAGLQMSDADMAYGMLLGIPSESSLCNGTVRVVAGNPSESCLILFYEGRLRDELDWVDTVEIDLVREWIAQGALP